MPDYTSMTATPDDVVKPYTFIGKAQVKESGKIENMGSISTTLDCGESYHIQKGYYNGTGKVVANSLVSQTPGTIIPEKMISGKNAWVNGVLVTGNTHLETATPTSPGYALAATYEDNFLKAQIYNAAYKEPTNCVYISNVIMWSALNISLSRFSPLISICGHKGTFASDSDIPANKIRYGKIGYNRAGRLVGTLTITTLY